MVKRDKVPAITVSGATVNPDKTDEIKEKSGYHIR
jgi:hypothetical protein